MRNLTFQKNFTPTMKGDNKMGKKKDYKKFMKMFQNGAFPMPPVPPMPFAPVPGNKNSTEESEDAQARINAQKENMKSTVKSAWTQRNERRKAAADNRREQWKQNLDYMQELQNTFAASLPDEMPCAQMLPIDPKAFMEWLKEFQIMANEHFMEQVDSAMDFYFRGQEQFVDMISAAMDKKEEEAETDSAEEKAVRKPRTKAAQKNSTKTRKPAGTKSGRKPRTKAADNTVKEAESKTVESES